MIPLFILHWNRPSECVKTVKAFLEQEGVALLPHVIDNGSTPENLQRLTDDLPREVAVTRLDQNHGWGAAFNRTLRNWIKSSDDFCLVSAHDALPGPGCVQRLLEAMTANERVGIACPEYGDGSIVKFSRWRGIYVTSVPRGQPSNIEYMPAPHGTLGMFRRQCLQEIGLFDERYFAYGDETEIGLRAGRSGWRSAMVWGALVTNPGSWSPRPLVCYLFARNSLLTIRIHAGPVWAVVRLLLKCATFGRDQHGLLGSLPLVRARWQGMFDFCRGSFGPPPSRFVITPPRMSSSPRGI